MADTFLADLVDHKARVAGYMQIVANDLFRRAAVHDASKFGPEEFEPYDKAFPDLQKYAYGTPELRAVYKSIKPALKHHFEANDHHPEHFAHQVLEMNLMQIIEMVCDWLAASERSQTEFSQGLEINKERFSIDEQLFEIIRNTAIDLAPGKFSVVDPLI